jgi:hypothetical protein
LFDARARWADQLALVERWSGGAHAFGLHCLERAKALGGPGHIRRTTDTEVKTPFDCYHYRIIHQTFFGMRDVLRPLSRRKGTSILPFQYERLESARRVVLEACPASTLKRLGLPHQNYKQPRGGPLERRRLQTRRTLLAALSPLVEIRETQRRVLMRNPGGDALDSLIAALGALQAWPVSDHQQIAGHARYPHEGHIYA